VQHYGLRWIDLRTTEEARQAIAQIGADPMGVVKMADKGIARALKLERVPLRLAHILKQEMLSSGGDAAVHREVIVGGVAETDVLLLGTVRQLRVLADQLRLQPFGLRDLGEWITRLLHVVDAAPERVLDCRGHLLPLGKRTLIMGILNVTPDSFSDGGKFVDRESAVLRARQIVAEGADILDIGAESTRHGAREITARQEWERLESILPDLLTKIDIPISVDTSKAEIAQQALDLGVHMINDVWGLQRDARLAQLLGKYQVPVVVMHNQQEPNYHHLLGDVLSFLRQSIGIAEEHGLTGDQIIIDPGFGFAKTPAQNLEIMARLTEFKSLGHPILLGASRKSTLGHVLDLPVEERLEGTLAAHVLGIAAGADIIRVHDVAAHDRAVRIADAIVREQRGTHYAGA
jgi:dihydropteroate synthase